MSNLHYYFSSISPLLTARRKHSSCVLDGKIYVIGGVGKNNQNNDIYLKSVEIYDPVTEEWREGGSLPDSRHEHSSCVLDGKIYVIGGVVNSAIVKTVKIYDPQTERWGDGEALLSVRKVHSSCVLDDKIYVIGGVGKNNQNNDIYLDTVEIYDPVTVKWDSGGEVSKATSLHSSCVLNGNIYVIGGWNNSGIVGDIQIYDPVTKAPTTTLKTPIALNPARCELSSSVVNDKIYSIAGVNHSIAATTQECLKDIEIYDPNTQESIKYGEIKIDRREHSSCALDGKIYIIGGRRYNNQTLDSVEVLTVVPEWEIEEEQDKKSSNEYSVISTTAPILPGKDFTNLRKEGLSHIQKLARSTWTDYNIHDPGITILEHLCYAITDLSYRLSFEMKDLLATAPNSLKGQLRLFTPREILTTGPLTVDDYRLLLLDIEGVQNAWIEAWAKQIGESRIESLYRVIVEPAFGQKEEELLTKVKVILHKNRSLGVDFHEIKILKPQTLTIKAEIEIQNEADANDVMIEIYNSLRIFLSPRIHFYSFKEMLAKGKEVEEIFNGPSLEHGFIDSEELEQFARKDIIYLSDIIALIFKTSKIKVIKEIAISSNEENTNLHLKPEAFWKLEEIDSAIGNIKLYKNGTRITLDKTKIKVAFTATYNEEKTIKENDLLLPVGRYRNLKDYTSILEDFPANYGMQNYTPSINESPERIAQARQLKAYLLFYDQILINYLARLAKAKDLFSLNDSLENAESIEDALVNSSNFNNLTAQGYKLALQESDEVKLTRNNKIADHLLSRFGEDLQNYSVPLHKKIYWLKNYSVLSSQRNKGFNYINDKLEENIVLKQRINTLAEASFGKAIGEFYIIEHILLRPFADNDWSKVDYLLKLQAKIGDIYSYQISFVFPVTFKAQYEVELKKIIAREVPVHLSPRLCWLENTEMTTFKEVYAAWLKLIKEHKFAIDTEKPPANRLMELLMGFKGIGSMIIDQDFIVA